MKAHYSSVWHETLVLCLCWQHDGRVGSLIRNGDGSGGGQHRCSSQSIGKERKTA